MSPPLAPHTTGLLARPGGHQIHWEESGTPQGLPVVHLDGGPGNGIGGGGYRRRYDPDRYRIISLDQRGCGRSTPSVISAGASRAGSSMAFRGGPRWRWRTRSVIRLGCGR